MSARSLLVPVAPEAEALPRRSDTPGTALELMVLAADAQYCAGIDLVSGAIVRAWTPTPIDVDLRPYDVVEGTLDDTFDLLPDPSQPEAVPLVEAPERVGQVNGRRVERYLRAVLHPPGQPLLAIHGPAIPFWQRTSDYPTIAVVEPEGPAVIRRRDAALSCLFRWRGVPVELPCVDRRLSAALAAVGRTRVDTGKGERLLVALGPPVEGHCHKVVEGLLPRP
ncbi:MAG TPA: hypothetical protein VHT75_16975 [Acidimicrobiales bacterium]|jgi:hypothetical protein|nr:hypothetical protein [Acidimicrobiales bacterium]